MRLYRAGPLRQQSPLEELSFIPSLPTAQGGPVRGGYELVKLCRGHWPVAQPGRGRLAQVDPEGDDELRTPGRGRGVTLQRVLGEHGVPVEEHDEVVVGQRGVRLERAEPVVADLVQPRDPGVSAPGVDDAGDSPSRRGRDRPEQITDRRVVGVAGDDDRSGRPGLCRQRCQAGLQVSRRVRGNDHMAACVCGVSHGASVARPAAPPVPSPIAAGVRAVRICEVS